VMVTREATREAEASSSSSSTVSSGSGTLKSSAPNWIGQAGLLPLLSSSSSSQHAAVKGSSYGARDVAEERIPNV
jgi:hypothetical protein